MTEGDNVKEYETSEEVGAKPKKLTARNRLTLRKSHSTSHKTSTTEKTSSPANPAPVVGAPPAANEGVSSTDLELELCNNYLQVREREIVLSQRLAATNAQLKRILEEKNSLEESLNGTKMEKSDIREKLLNTKGEPKEGELETPSVAAETAPVTRKASSVSRKNSHSEVEPVPTDDQFKVIEAFKITEDMVREGLEPNFNELLQACRQLNFIGYERKGDSSDATHKSKIPVHHITHLLKKKHFETVNVQIVGGISIQSTEAKSAQPQEGAEKIYIDDSFTALYIEQHGNKNYYIWVEI